MKYDYELVKRIAGSQINTERNVEVPFVLDNIADDVLDILDVGCCESTLIKELDKIGYLVVGTDINDYLYGYKYFCYADARSLPFEDNVFDLVTCISAMEHFGLVDTPYKTDEIVDEEAGFKAIKEIARVTRKDVIITLPYGIESDELKSWVRFYDKTRLNCLIEVSGLNLTKISYSVKIDGKWVPTDEKQASMIKSTNEVLSNVCILLRKE